MSDLVPFGRRVRELAQEFGDNTAVTCVSRAGIRRTLSWTELDERSTQFARLLAGRGLKTNDRLLLGIGNSPELVIAIFAGWKVGATVIPMRPSLPEWESQRVIAAADAAIIIRADAMDLFEKSLTYPTEPVPDAVAAHASGICSSGSTGSPKVIVRQTASLWNPASPKVPIAGSWASVSPEQLILTPGPIYHNNGFSFTNDILAGNPVVILEEFTAELALDVVEHLRVTGFVATTILLQRMSRVPDVDSRDLSSIEWVLQGGSFLPTWLAKHWMSLIGEQRFFVCYGQSERVGVTACRGDEWLSHESTVGKPYAGTSVRILDENLLPVPVGTIGEVYLRPAGGAKHTYLGNATQAPVTAEGYTTVGDMGWLDEEGYLYLSDRRVDLIKSGGVNVFPAEIEAALSEHPDIADVVVVGVRDEEWGHRVHAVVQPREGASLTAAEVVGYAKSKLTNYKVPRTVSIVDRIPRTEATKINRKALAETYGGG
jgi:bile acid-coenzyme A ligase